MVYQLVTNGDVPDQVYFNGLMNQSIVPCTSGTRPTPSHNGMTIWETDTLLHATWNGSAWIYPYAPDWQNWSAVVRNNGISGTPASISVTIDHARYKQVRDMVWYSFALTVNAAASNGASISLPVSSPTIRTHHSGQLWVFGTGAPTDQVGVAYQGGGPSAPWDRLYAVNVNTGLRDFASGNVVRGSGFYRVG